MTSGGPERPGGVRYEPNEKTAHRACRRPRPAARRALHRRSRADACHRGPRRGRCGILPDVGRLRRSSGQRHHLGVAGASGRADRRRLCPRHGHLGRLHRNLRRRRRPGRPGHARDPGGDLIPFPVPARVAIVAAAANPYAHRRRHGDHADPGHGDAHRLRHADTGAAGHARACRAALGPGHRAGHSRHRAQGDGRAAALGAGHRHRGRLRGCRLFRHLRGRPHRRRSLDRAAGRRSGRASISTSGRSSGACCRRSCS